MLLKKNLYINFFLMTLIIFMNFFSLSISDLLYIWFFMEVSSFFFISYLLMNLNNKKMVFFYYLIQFFSSLVMLISMLFLNYFIINDYFKWIFLISLMMKLSIPPFHFWLFILIKYLNWFKIIFMLYIQKIIPFYMLSFNLFNSKIYWLMIIISLTIPPFNLINLKNFKMIFFYSSINQSGWLILLMLMKNLIWLIYFMLYSFIMMMIIFLINKFKLFLNLNYNNFKMMNMFILLGYLNLSGLPPFIFMMFKWFNIFIFLKSFNLNFLFYILMINSLIMMYIYLNMINIILFKKIYENKLIYLNNDNKLTYYMFIFLSILTILFLL